MFNQSAKELFQLNSAITFLNHGSFGACPFPIFKSYQNWQVQLENEPVQFMIKNGVEALKKSKELFAQYFKCASQDVVFMQNPSTAFNTVINSLQLNEGDEILSTNLEYGAMDRTWKFHCKKSGAKYVQQEITLPIESSEHFLEMFWQGYTSKTKYVFISQITSATALVLPVKEICIKAKSLGLITIIDGAHVPGHIPLDLTSLDPDYYTGALHKWMLAPKGFSFLYVKKVHQPKIEPLIVSWGYESDFPGESQFLDWHEFNGTRDFSAYLTMPAILNFWEQENWLNKAGKCRATLLENYPKFCDLLETKPICPITSAFLGQMCSIPIQTNKPLDLKNILYQKYKIEIPITNVGSQYFIRISFQAYNTQQDLDYLYSCLKEIKNEGVYLN